MRKIALRLVSLLIMLLVLACEQENVLTPEFTLEKDSVKLSALAQSIDIDIKINMDFDVSSNAEWLSASKTYSEDGSIIKITVLENYDGENDRTGTIVVTPKGSSMAFNIIVIQEAAGIVRVDDKTYYVTDAEQKIVINVKHNYDYNVIIPDDAKSWIEIEETDGTKALIESKLKLSISKNDLYKPRKAEIVLTMPSYNKYDTIRIVQEEGFESLRKAIRDNMECTIFYEALKLTGLEDSLLSYIDESYPEIDYEWTEQALKDGYRGVHEHRTSVEIDYIAIPDERLYKYTVFVMPDAMLASLNDDYCNGGIHNVDELREYAKAVYPQTADLPDTNRNSSLNKLLAYHILPCELTYDKLNVSYPEIRQKYLKWEEQDIEDFYETLLPHSVMRISTPVGNPMTPIGIFINRKGATHTGLKADGVMIYQETAGKRMDNTVINNHTPNGVFHYINKPLLYDNETRNNTLDCRMRIFASTMSPDFINSGAYRRLRQGSGMYDRMSMTFKPGYCKNVYWSRGTEFYVRYIDKDFGIYGGDEIDVMYDYDFVIKLPAVPHDGEYEIRIPNFVFPYLNFDRIAQFYLYSPNDSDVDNDWTSWNWQSCGNPIDLQIPGSDERIGIILDNDSRYDVMSENEKMAAIKENDQKVRENGYLKAIDSYGPDHIFSLRDDPNNYRIIICRQYFEADRDYYIRIKNVANDFNTYIVLNYFEIVPKSIYDGSEPEDWH